MKSLIIAFLLGLICGSSTLGKASDAGLNFTPVDEDQSISKWIAVLLSHKIDVPEKYSYGSGNSTYRATALMYVEEFESGWWECIKQCAKDPMRMSTDADRQNPEMRHRWILPVRVDGYRDGHRAAEERVAAIKRRFGEHSTQIILRNSGAFFLEDRWSLLAIIPPKELPEYKKP